MTSSLLNLELKKVFQIMVGLVLVLLVAITALAAQQYVLYRHCREAVSLSDQLLFGFTSIKEHISETLLTGARVDLQEVSKEIQAFDEQIKKIGADILIPKEFKGSFISQVDLVSLIVQLRAVQGREKGSAEQLHDLTASLRSVSGRLLHFHEVLSSYTRSLLLGLHRVLIGTLALVVFVVCSMLFFMHRYISEPLLRLCRAVHTTLGRSSDERTGGSARTSIAVLENLVQDTATEKQRLANLLTSLDNVSQTLPDYRDDPDFWETMCLALQTNPDYLLVWVGRPATDDQYPDPVTGCGCVSSSPVQCRQTIRQLITYCRQNGSLCDSARQAAADQRVVIASIPMSSIPAGLHPSLPFHENLEKMLLCASFPIMCEEELLAVVTIYSRSTACFAHNELAVLQLFFRQVGKLPEQGRQVHSASGLAGAGAGLYRYAVVGAMAAGIAHEMINTTNGTLNYSQALLDLTADKKSLSEERHLLEKLHQEELKTARLTAELTQLADKKAAIPEKTDFKLLLERSVRLLQEQFKQDGIQVTLDSRERLPSVIVPPQTVMIILLTMLKRAADQLNRQPGGRGEKRITAVLRPEHNNTILSLTVDNCPAQTESVEKIEVDLPWPDPAVCAEMTQRIGGRFETGVQGNPGTTCWTISLPVL